jgi:hypothetical protein
MARGKQVSTGVSLLLVVALAAAHVRIVYDGNGQAIYWNNPSSVSVVIQSTGSDNINDGSDEVALRNAIDAWNDVTSTTATLVEVQSAAQRARTDWQADDIHLMMFDESNQSGYFGPSSGTVAVTPLTFYITGAIIDADVLFNGGGYQFTTNGQSGRFDIQDVATHELGHLLGLDHSGVAGATMFPYVDPAVILHRSLSADDVGGLRHMYPAGSFGRIGGSLFRSDGSPVIGAQISVRDSAGRTAGAILTNSAGAFTVQALEPGTYSVLAVPMDQPVSAANLSNWYTIQTNFGATLMGQAVVTGGGTSSIGGQTALPNTSLSLGRSFDDFPQRVIMGQTTTHLLRGSGLVPGSILVASDPSMVLTPTGWNGSSVQFQVTCPAGVSLGHFDLSVTDPLGNFEILVGGLEVTPPNPTVTTVSPSAAIGAGGAVISLSGTGFRPGCRVIIGDQIYEEGQPGGASLVSSTSLRLVLAPTIGGLHDVVVMDRSGVEGRKVNGFTVQANPVIASVFPAVGQSFGGTLVRITGSDFQVGSSVHIDGAFQPLVSVISPSEIEVVTTGGVPGGPYILTVQVPSGEVASSAFQYESKPDPVLTEVSPASGTDKGGNTVTLSGLQLHSDLEVVFGANPSTGQGGSLAQVLTVTESQIEVSAPAWVASSASVLLRDSLTGQAFMLTGAYTYIASSQSHVGGACGSVIPTVPPGWRDLLSAGGWLLFLLVFGLGRARRGSLAALGVRAS